MFVGRDPGENEDILGRPFVGPAGRLLDQLLEHGQIDRSKIYITNIVKCRPPGNRQPTPDEKDACQNYLLDEILAVKPKMIVTLGGDALEAITGLNKVMKVAGTVINVKKESFGWEGQVFVTLHPSYILRNMTYLPRAEKHFEDIGRYYRGEGPKRVPVKYVYVTKEEQLTPLFEKMHQQEKIVFDLETNSLDFTVGKILCFSFSWKENSAVVLPILGYKCEEIWTADQKKLIWSLLSKVFANEKIEWIAHNISFDHKYLLANGIDIKGRMHDTMLLQHLLDENAVDMKGLKALALAYTDLGDYDRELDEVKQALKIQKSKGIAEKKKTIATALKAVQKSTEDDAVEMQDALEDLSDDLQDETIDVMYDEIPTDILWKYAATDSDATMRLFNHHIAQLEQQSNYYAPYHVPKMTLKRLYYGLVMPLRRVLDEMEFVGVRMDIDYLHKLDETFTKRVIELDEQFKNMPEIKEVEKRLLKQAKIKTSSKWHLLKSTKAWVQYQEDLKNGTWDSNTKPPKPPKFKTSAEYAEAHTKPITFNMNSNDHKRILLFDVLKCDKNGIPTTTGGQLATSKEVLEINEDKPGIALLLENAKIAKLHNTYVKGSLAKLVNTDAIHTNFNQHVTVTGRLSSSVPNLQNIPREDKQIKRAFVPRPGYTFIQADYSQAEFRMWCQLSQDEDMLRDIEAGLDIHRQTASDFWGIPQKEVTKQQRSAAKFVVFGLMYGRGAASVAKQVKTITKEEAEVIKKKFFDRYPKAAEWLEQTRRDARERQFIPGFFGRVRRLPHAISPDQEKVAEAMRQAVNSPIQGSAADITGIGLIRIREMIINEGWVDIVRPLLTVHDSVLFEVREDYVIDVVDKLIPCMISNLPNMRVPMAVEIEIGKNWGDLGSWEDHLKEKKAA